MRVQSNKDFTCHALIDGFLCSRHDFCSIFLVLPPFHEKSVKTWSAIPGFFGYLCWSKLSIQSLINDTNTCLVHVLRYCDFLTAKLCFLKLKLQGDEISHGKARSTRTFAPNFVFWATSSPQKHVFPSFFILKKRNWAASSIILKDSGAIIHFSYRTLL